MRRSVRSTLVGLALLSGIALVFFDVDYVAADPQDYYFRMKAILAGGAVPYVEAPFEHLPTMLIPMTAAWFLGGSASPLAYRIAWAVMSVGALVACAWQMVHLAGQAKEKPAVARSILMSLPLVPLILFRNDAWAVLLALVAVSLVWGGRRGTGVAATAAVLAKGWPVVILAAMWRSGRRRLALVVLVVSGSVLATVSSLPGFISARQFSGLHTETLGGSIFGLSEALGGKRPTLLMNAGAIYVDAPAWMAIPGVTLGLLFALCSVWLLATRRLTRSEVMTAMGVALIAILLASPLQSSQFVFWSVPFVAFSSRRLALVCQTLAGVLSTWSVARLPLLREGSWAWYSTVVFRNLLMVVVAAALIAELMKPRSDSEDRSAISAELQV